MVEQRLLEFDVTKQRLSKRKGCDFSFIVSGSVGYLRAKFYFSKEWDGCAKAASFWSPDGKEYPVLLDKDNSCDIRPEALVGDSFSVSMTGARSGYRITSSKIRIKQEVC